ELLYRGYAVDVGLVEMVEKDKNGKSIRKQYEVDFVTNDNDRRFYIQSAFSIPDEAKMIQETASFRRIDDSFQRIIVTHDNILPYRNTDGVLIVGLFDFLLKPEFLSANYQS
ncbi:MAG: ATP-binding protein, partial [Muribaculaceae bacterium]